MTSKSEKDKQKLIQERCQQFLTDLLKDEDNKYCVDCDAKGPRWASWNLGVFLCIRCAGIHRNLGVHISKVKSVNLDAWTPEQVAHLQQMGNSKARAVYEANMPDNFRRPQTDSTLEAFIRSKYEQKKYIAKEWAPPPTPPPAFDIEEERKKEKDKKKSRSTVLNKNPGSGSPSSEIQTNSVPRPHSNPAGTTISADKVPKDGAKNNVSGGSKSSEDLLGLGLDFSSSPTTPASVTATPVAEEDPFDAFVSATNSTNPSAAAPLTLAEEESDFFNQKVTDKKMDKDSILKMFDSSSNFIAAGTAAASFGAGHSAAGLHSLNNNNFFSTPAANLVPQAALLQNGSGQPISNQAMFNSATNPFLASAPNIPNASANLFQDLSSLSLGSGSSSNWMSASAAAAPQPQRPAAFDLINPFNASTMPAPVPASSVSMFADFSQAMPVKAATTEPTAAQNWAFPSSNPIEASRTLPSTDLWQ